MLQLYIFLIINNLIKIIFIKSGENWGKQNSKMGIFSSQITNANYRFYSGNIPWHHSTVYSKKKMNALISLQSLSDQIPILPISILQQRHLPSKKSINLIPIFLAIYIHSCQLKIDGTYRMFPDSRIFFFPFQVLTTINSHQFPVGLKTFENFIPP